MILTREDFIKIAEGQDSQAIGVREQQANMAENRTQLEGLFDHGPTSIGSALPDIGKKRETSSPFLKVALAVQEVAPERRQMFASFLSELNQIGA